MERLEPVLKQKFWILLGLAIIMTFVGWWMATGTMVQAIESRTKVINDAFTSVPSGAIPNESWAKKLSALNETQEKSITQTKLAMWKRQVTKMSWPEGIEPPKGRINGYREKFPTSKRELYRDAYADYVQQIWKLVNPLEPNGSGVVYYPFDNMYRVLKHRPQEWANSLPKVEVMWDIQEDLWLLESLFDSITTINGGPEGMRGDAYIHQIVKIELRGGGDIKEDASATAASDNGMFGEQGAPQGYGGMGGRMGGMGGGRGGGLSAGLTVVSAEFDPVEEFGDDGSSASKGGGMGAMVAAMSMPSGEVAEPAEEKVINRYLMPDDPKLPYKKRGFYLSVKMDHTRIPQFLAELTASEKSVWPVEILRVQMARINEDDDTPAVGAGGAGGGRGFNPMMRAMPIMAPPANSLSSFPGAGGLAGNAVNDEDSPMPGGGLGLSRGGTIEFDNTTVAQTARSAYENVLKEPTMANVTICGVFTLYRKVDEVIEAPPAAVPESPATGTGETAQQSEESASDNGDAVAPSDKAPEEDGQPVAVKPEAAPMTETEEPAEPEPGAGDDPDAPAAPTDSPVVPQKK